MTTTTCSAAAAGRAVRCTRSYDRFFNLFKAGCYPVADVELDVDAECEGCGGDGVVEAMGHFHCATVVPPYMDVTCDACDGLGVVLAARCRGCRLINECVCEE